MNYFGFVVGALYLGASAYEFFARGGRWLAVVYLPYAIAGVALAMVKEG